ncbi:MAG: S9 family peptidase [Candidatus Eremiobacteraeota bacterium]|nr:S9 family peptidase [Candidatus Eremiobacteraeota bacterium]
MATTRMHKIMSALLGGLLVYGVCTSAGVARQISLRDVQDLIQVSDPHFSPDGKQVVYVVSRPDISAARYDSQLAVVDVGTRTTRQLTYNRKGVSSPRWSPDGRVLAFIARESDADEDHDQIFVMPMNGGDARQVSHADNDVEQFAWKPDSSAIAYVVADVAKDKGRIKKHHDGFEVHANDYLTTQAPTSSHVWIIPRSGGRARRLTHGAWSVSVAAVSGAESPLAWSPDGRKIALRMFPGPYYGDADGAHVVVLDVASGAVSRVSDHAGLESSPQFAPGGDALAYQMPKLGLHDNGEDIFLTSPSGGNGRDISASLDRSISWYRWLPAGNAMLVAAADRASNAMWRMDRNGIVQRLNLGDLMMDSDGDVAPTGAVAFVGESVKRPLEIYLLPSPGDAPQALTRYNRGVSALELGDAREITWRGPGGFDEDGIVTYPPHWAPTRKYPLVLVIHGGPEGASTLGFGDLNQLLAAHGYLVFEPNYRASTNLGDAYERAIIGDTGDGPGKDVMAGIAAVEKSAFVDTQRIGVSGWSYGGFMTSWLEGHYSIWKAAVSGAALNDWLMDYDISWYVNNDLFYFGGPPYAGAHAQAWRTQSPIEYVRNIKTPTLILGDVYDANVPIVNSYEMFRALQVQHVPVKFIAYPIQPHFPDDPVHLIDVYKEWIGWMDAYLR